MSIKKYYNLGKNILYPINRSITGKGTRKTLAIIKSQFPNLKIKSIKSGTKAFDWTVPPEWNVKEAYIEDKYGEKIIDFKNNNLHLLGYSMPVKKKILKQELLSRIDVLEKQPNAIPYICSYYKKTWGFCTSFNQKKKIMKEYKKKDSFKIIIDSRFDKKGSLNYGELVLKGKSKKEILISTYICHPSMANNELSGPIVSMALIEYFKKRKLKKTIRFVFIPETIGSIAYLSKNLINLKKNVIGGFVLSCIGDEKNHSCMLTKYENSPSDESILEAYKKLRIVKYKVYSFLDRGSDERQYNSPGIDLNIASIFRTKYGEYPEYHTSLDDFKLVTLKGIYGGYRVARKAIENLINKTIPKNIYLGEPQLGKRNLYHKKTSKYKNHNQLKYMDFLQYADGKNSLEKISSKININLKTTKKIYKLFIKNNLIN
jgi:aminopeptidase-like protein